MNNCYDLKKENSDLVDVTLNDKSASTSRHQLSENLFKIARNLFESPFNGLIFSLVKHLHEFFN